MRKALIFAPNINILEHKVHTIDRNVFVSEIIGIEIIKYSREIISKKLKLKLIDWIYVYHLCIPFLKNGDINYYSRWQQTKIKIIKSKSMTRHTDPQITKIIHVEF